MNLRRSRWCKASIRPTIRCDQFQMCSRLFFIINTCRRGLVIARLHEGWRPSVPELITSSGTSRSVSNMLDIFVSLHYFRCQSGRSAHRSRYNCNLQLQLQLTAITATYSYNCNLQLQIASGTAQNQSTKTTRNVNSYKKYVSKERRCMKDLKHRPAETIQSLV